MSKAGPWIAAAAATALALGGTSPAAWAASAPVPAVRSATAAGDTASAVKSFRSSMSAQLRQYLTTYGSRLAEAERARVDALIAEADADLARLSNLAASTATWERRGNRSRAQRAARAAVTAFDTSYARAEAAVNEMTPILQPHLNLFEALDAKAALDQRMAAYRNLGGQLRNVQASLRN